MPEQDQSFSVIGERELSVPVLDELSPEVRSYADFKQRLKREKRLQKESCIFEALLFFYPGYKSAGISEQIID